MRKFLLFLLRLTIALVVASIAWVLFVIYQQVHYSESDQLYLVGTNSSYTFVFIFFCIVMFFIFSFIKHRKNPAKIKRRFFIFSAFYLLFSPLVIMSFDNYLLITSKGIAYNEFFHLETTPIKRWSEINRVELDYQLVNFSLRQDEKIRLKYIIKFKDGSSVDLNNYNSPLFRADQFYKIHRALLKNGVSVKIKRPLPEKYSDPNSFVYKMYHFKP